MKFKINDISYFVNRHQQFEDKPNLILLHGFMGSGKGFEYLIEALCSFCNPITVDLLGHGQTGGAESPARFAVDQQVEDLNKLIPQLSDALPYLYGYSMGGRLALRFAIEHPVAIRGLILESTNYGLENEHDIRKRKQLDEKRARAIENNFKSFLKEWQQLPLFRTENSLSEEKLHPYRAIQNQQKATQMAHSLRGFGTAEMHSVKNELAGLEIPVLLLAGEADLKYVKIARQMHQQLPTSDLSIIPKAGHRIHIEHPRNLVNSIKSFINQH